MKFIIGSNFFGSEDTLFQDDERQIAQLLQRELCRIRVSEI